MSVNFPQNFSDIFSSHPLAAAYHNVTVLITFKIQPRKYLLMNTNIYDCMDYASEQNIQKATGGMFLCCQWSALYKCQHTLLFTDNTHTSQYT